MLEALQWIINNVIWGWPLILLVLGMGIYITLGAKGFQFRHILHIFTSIFSKDKDAKDKAISPLEAISIAIGAAVGVGNIGGVATAIAVGGPGAVFWMWLVAIVGMGTKMAEVTLSVHYRQTDENGMHFGGPSYYMEKGLGEEQGHKWWKILMVIFTVGICGTFFFPLVNYNTSLAISTTFDIPILPVSFVYALCVFFFTVKGVKVMAKISRVLIPAMCIFYLASGLWVIILNAPELPAALALIFKSAFTSQAATGGFAGAAFSVVIRQGVARAVYSNEAGWGTSPMIHAKADTTHPVKQGILGAFEVFADTMLVCTITALMIIVTGQWSSGLTSSALTLSALEKGFGHAGNVILSIGLFLFAISTSSGFFLYIETILNHAFGNNKLKNKILHIYKYVYPIPAFTMTLVITLVGMPGQQIWMFADYCTGIPTFANLISLFFLAPKFFELLKDYKARYLGIGEIDPDFVLFYEDKVKSSTKDKKTN